MRLIARWLRNWFKFGLFALMLTVVVACGGTTSDGSPYSPEPAPDVNASMGTPTGAIAQTTMVGLESNPDIKGQITLEETTDGLKLQGQFVNVPPGLHGIHIHEGSSCAEAGSAAGGHFNPRQVKHGDLKAEGFENAHAGDLGNLDASADGTADWQIEIPGLALDEGDFAVSGRAMILHADPDDFGQPTGNAGGRIACGIIEAQ